MPLEGAQPSYATRAQEKKRSLREARTEREERECLRGALTSHLRAPKPRGYRSFLLRNAKSIYRFVLTRPERAVIREEWERIRKASVRYEVSATSHIDLEHQPSATCEECFVDLLDTVLRRRNGAN
jgi:hypothetical protein